MPLQRRQRQKIKWMHIRQEKDGTLCGAKMKEMARAFTWVQNVVCALKGEIKEKIVRLFLSSEKIWISFHPQIVPSKNGDMHYKDQLKYALVVSFFSYTTSFGRYFLTRSSCCAHVDSWKLSCTVLCVSITRALSFFTLISRLGLSLTKTNPIKPVLIIEIMVK